MALDSMQEILERMEAEDKPFWQVVQDTDREERQVTAEASEEKIRATWQAMLESVTAYQGERMSLSGLVGGDGERMRRYAREKQPLSGAYLQEVIATALCVGESNACMRKIVAAPTAGACGVLPAVLVPLYQSGQAGGRRSSGRCMWRRASARWWATGPASPVPPVGARRRSALPAPWRPER